MESKLKKNNENFVNKDGAINRCAKDGKLKLFSFDNFKLKHFKNFRLKATYMFIFRYCINVLNF